MFHPSSAITLEYTELSEHFFYIKFPMIPSNAQNVSSLSLPLHVCLQTIIKCL
jgi:hypothetical protein